ncbi:hypothetical protein [Limosilactobacillus gastricus]|uniref:hypothetical protein n=1 Tax=Limosilactobacillus gastricus TaxID=227942 RepID=UPI0002E5B06B|nr:hypothetical protein [Limosilactobacillus gastricus]
MVQISSETSTVNGVVANFKKVEVSGSSISPGVSNLTGMENGVKAGNQLLEQGLKLTETIQRLANEFNQIDSKKHTDDNNDARGFGIQ